MFSWITNPNILAGGFILALVQLLAALPWLRSIDSRTFDANFKTPKGIGYALLGYLAIGVLFSAYIGYKGDSTSFVWYGRIYGFALHVQLLIDLFILGPSIFAFVFPKTGAVALAAYREGWRQPLFWLIIGFSVLATWISVIIPYFTFGDDFKMMKQIGFDIIMLAGIVFGVLAASMSISEEIEGRTAITVMSKPINRRQFLIGKFLGILMACGAMSLLLGVNLNGALIACPEFDPINRDRAFDPMPEQSKANLVPLVQKVVPAGPARTIAEGAGMWIGESFAHTFGLLLDFGQVMVLVAIATALATRLPFVVNVVICLAVYFLGHLAPVVVRVSEAKAKNSNNVGIGLINFLGNLFDTLLPALEFFNMGPAIIRETPIDLWEFSGYASTVFGMSIIYTLIALVIGLLMFEDRDLA